VKTRAFARILAGTLIVDGVRRLVVGHPTLLQRALGVAEAGLGLATLSRVPLSVPELYQAFALVYDPTSQLYRKQQFPEIHRAFDRQLATHVTPSARILDLGCGTGANLERIRDLGLPFASYTGVDLTDAMLARARAKFAGWPNVRFQQLNLLTDPLPDGPFDLVISTWVFEHLPDPSPVVDKALQRLAPEGHAILLFLADNHAWYTPALRFLMGIGSARLVSDDVAGHFPGLVSLEHFANGFQTLVVLAKKDLVTGSLEEDVRRAGMTF